MNINDKLTFKTQDNPPQIGQYDYLYDELEELKEQATASGNQICIFHLELMLLSGFVSFSSGAAGKEGRKVFSICSN